MVGKKFISNSKLELSELALGMWHINELNSNELDILVNTAIENGLTTLDHADIYGSYTCEEAFGKWMKANSNKREELQLVSKCGIKLLSPNRPEHGIKHYDTSSNHIIASVDNSLKKLKTGYLDLLLIHRPNPLMDVHEMAEAFSELKRAGKVKFFGVSNFTPAQFDLLNKACDKALVTNQIEISLFQNTSMFDGTLDHLQKININPMAWSPLGGSKNIKAAIESEKLQSIAKKYNLDIGNLLLIWLLKHPAGIFPVLGTMKSDRVKSAAESYQTEIETEDWFEMLKFARGHDVA